MGNALTVSREAHTESWYGPDAPFELDTDPLSSATTVLLAEEDPLLCELLTDVLQRVPGFEVITTVSRPADVRDYLTPPLPGVLLLDLGMGEEDSVRLVEDLACTTEGLKILVMCSDEREETALKLARAGAHGFLSKRYAREQLPRALRHVALGEVWFSRRVVGLIFNEYPTLARRAREREGPVSLLSDRERQVLLRVARGLTNKQIADELFMSISTVKSHIRSVFQKLDLTSRTEAAIFAVREHLAERIERPAGS